MIQIKDRTGRVLYESAGAETISEALEEAVRSGANLTGAILDLDLIALRGPVLASAAKILEQDGWCQGRLYDAETGARCVRGGAHRGLLPARPWAGRAGSGGRGGPIRAGRSGYGLERHGEAHRYRSPHGATLGRYGRGGLVMAHDSEVDLDPYGCEALVLAGLARVLLLIS